jgi:ATP-binding cassette subfamily B protein
MTATHMNQWRIRDLLYPLRWRIGVVFVFSTLSAAALVTQPYLYHYAIDNVALQTGLTMQQRMSRLIGIIVAMCGLVLIAGIASYLHGYRAETLNSIISARLRQRLLKHMLTLPLHTLVTMKTGGAAARLEQDTTAVSQIATRGVILPAVALIQIAAALTMLFVLNWRLSLAALFVIAVTGLLTKRFAQRLRPLFADIAQLGNELSSRSTEMFAGIRVTRIYRRECAERRLYSRMYHHVVRRRLAVRRKQLAIDTFTSLSFALIQVVIVSLGVFLIVYQQATVGDIFAVVIYCNRIMSPIDQLIQVYHQSQEDLAAFDRIGEVLAMAPDVLGRPGLGEPPTKITGIAFQEVGFRYNGTNKNALANINVQIEGNTTVALVGRSGAGKSTFTDLIARFYEPTEGTIHLNGRDIREISLSGYRKLLGLVQQDTFLFDGTVRENIAYGVPHADENKLIQAARRANAHAFIVELPRGYDTVIGERGVRLSGGQRQRLSIARAFLVDPEILILDEATSSLDTESEELIQRAMKELLRDRTAFIIAHRLSTITCADLIIVLDEGRIREMGTHQQLVARGDLYFEMIERQQKQLNGSFIPDSLQPGRRACVPHS